MHIEKQKLSKEFTEYVNKNIDKALDNLDVLWRELQDDYDKMSWWKKLCYPKYDVCYAIYKEPTEENTWAQNILADSRRLYAIKHVLDGHVQGYALDTDDVMLVAEWTNKTKSELIRDLNRRG